MISFFGTSTLTSLNLEEYWKFIILGIVQGCTEFIPISSTAHLKVVSVFLGWGDPGLSNSAFIQIGSVLAVIIYFLRDLKKIFKLTLKVLFRGQFFHPNTALSSSIIIGTLPIIYVGMVV